MKKSNIMLSIIVPVFNVEKYLEECVISILNADLKNFEIILVDDGSTDRSSKICDNLKKKYNNIVVIHKQNGGLSSARNAGIKVANGKYLMFVDSDDKINKFDFNEFIKGNPDVIQYKMVYFYENNNRYVHLRDICIDKNDVKDIIYQQIQLGTLSVSACDKIIKKDIIINNELFFKTGLLSEDINWSLELYLNINSIKVFNEEVYVYRQQRTGSITNKTTNKNITSIIYILKRWLNYDYESEDVKKIYINYLAYLYCILITISKKNNTTKEQRKFIKNNKSIIKNDANYKVKYCNKAIHFLGFRFGIFLLRLYLNIKNKGLIKL